MSTFLTSFWCCIWWFLAGFLLGWLLNRWLCKCSSKNDSTNNNTDNSSTSTINKIAEPQATTANNLIAHTPQIAPVSAPTTPIVSEPAKLSIDLAAAKKAGFHLKHADDLTVIEGIGPKINALFNEAGIKTFAQLTNTTVSQMRQILDNGGARFRLANPSTWAQQAGLAATNNWAELKKLQDDLSGGIKKTI